MGDLCAICLAIAAAVFGVDCYNYLPLKRWHTLLGNVAASVGGFLLIYAFAVGWYDAVMVWLLPLWFLVTSLWTRGDYNAPLGDLTLIDGWCAAYSWAFFVACAWWPLVAVCMFSFLGITLTALIFCRVLVPKCEPNLWIFGTLIALQLSAYAYDANGELELYGLALVPTYVECSLTVDPPSSVERANLHLFSYAVVLALRHQLLWAVVFTVMIVLVSAYLSVDRSGTGHNSKDEASNEILPTIYTPEPFARVRYGPSKRRRRRRQRRRRTNQMY